MFLGVDMRYELLRTARGRVLVMLPKATSVRLRIYQLRRHPDKIPSLIYRNRYKCLLMFYFRPSMLQYSSAAHALSLHEHQGSVTLRIGSESTRGMITWIVIEVPYLS